MKNNTPEHEVANGGSEVAKRLLRVNRVVPLGRPRPAPDKQTSSEPAGMGRFARNALDAEQRRALHNLPPRINLGDGILACHGTPDDDSICLLEESHDDGRFVPARRDILKARLENAATARVVLCGHSHRQSVIHGPSGCLIVNPGSVGCPVFADIPLLLRTSNIALHMPVMLSLRGEVEVGV
jgi:diadenosine tetraphosphatase ApaH/serine/threonine PP2A family protein phosphatase